MHALLAELLLSCLNNTTVTW